jgi:hypothetical protein
MPLQVVLCESTLHRAYAAGKHALSSVEGRRGSDRGGAEKTEKDDQMRKGS